MNKYRTLVASWFFLQASLSAQIGEERDWTSADGRVITAKLQQMNPDAIIIVRDGNRVTIPLNLLSETDQEFVTSLRENEAIELRRRQGFQEGKYADAVQGEWVKYEKDQLGLLYQLYIGKEVTRKKAGPLVPLFIHLHGAAGRADDVAPGKVEVAAKMLAQPERYEKFPCVICVPTCPPEPQTWSKQTAKLEAIVDDLVGNLPIDRNRIYLSGYSQGARGIGKMLESRPESYAAAIFADGGPSERWVGTVKTPLWSYFSGERDSSKASALQAQFAEHGVEYRFDVFPNVVHNSIHWTLAKDSQVFEWVFMQEKTPSKEE